MTHSQARATSRLADRAFPLLLRTFAVLLGIAYAVAALRFACMLGGMTP